VLALKTEFALKFV